MQAELKCEECLKVLSSSSSLAAHKLTHSTRKPWVCDICNRGFNQKAKLKEHINRHLNERPFVCKTCGKGFSRKTGLKLMRCLTHRTGHLSATSVRNLSGANTNWHAIPSFMTRKRRRDYSNTSARSAVRNLTLPQTTRSTCSSTLLKSSGTALSARRCSKTSIVSVITCLLCIKTAWVKIYYQHFQRS